MKHGELLKAYAEKNNINVSRMGRELEMDRSQIYSLFKSEKFKEPTYKRIVEKYPNFEINTTQISHVENTAHEPITKYTHAPAGKFPKKIGLGSKPVPYFDVDFTAGDIEVYDDNQALQPAYMMDIPEFSGCTAFRVFSNSMERLIVSGSILFGTKVAEWTDHIEYGQIYGIVCNDKRRYLKYIRKAPSKDDTHFLLKSENVAEFDDFLMPKNKIKSIWLIHGWLNKRN